MKIAFLSRYQNTTARGAESFVNELSAQLSRNHQVVILSGSDADDFNKMTSGDYDVVFAINGRLQSLKASLGRIKGKFKLIITGQSGVGRDDIWNIAAAKPDVFVALTDYMEEWAKKWAWGSRVVKIPNGVDIKKFNPDGEAYKVDLPKPIILSVGALEWYKHHELTINAVARLSDVSLLIVGKGSQKEMLSELAEKTVPGRYKIIQVPYSEIPTVYRSADLFVLPSWNREAFGIVYLEALASGLPIVAPRDCPRQEIVGDAGILVRVDNPLKYSQAIKEALQKKWGNIPRNQADKFSWDKIGEKYLQMLEALH